MVISFAAFMHHFVLCLCMKCDVWGWGEFEDLGRLLLSWECFIALRQFWI